MDIATVIGIVGALGIIAVAMVLSGGIVLFINVPSILVVFGGASFAVMAMFPLGVTIGSFKIMLKSILNKPDDPNELIEKGVELATIARKEGILGLEGQEIANEFLQKGISLCVDGHEPDFVQRMLSKDINLAVERHEWGQKFFMKIADMGPAMGMIGTLIGLVGMLANMDDQNYWTLYGRCSVNYPVRSCSGQCPVYSHCRQTGLDCGSAAPEPVSYSGNYRCYSGRY